MTTERTQKELQQPTFKELLDYLAILSEGYVKPDLAKQERIPSGIVRETKKYFPYIDALNTELCNRAGCDENIERIEIGKH